VLRRVHDRETRVHALQSGSQEAEESQCGRLSSAVLGPGRQIGCLGEAGGGSIERDLPELDRPQPDQCVNTIGVGWRESADQPLIGRVCHERVVAKGGECCETERRGPIRRVTRQPRAPAGTDRAGAVTLESALGLLRYVAWRFRLPSLEAGQGTEEKQEGQHYR
jgi:hypothetical protein